MRPHAKGAEGISRMKTTTPLPSQLSRTRIASARREQEESDQRTAVGSQKMGRKRRQIILEHICPFCAQRLIYRVYNGQRADSIFRTKIQQHREVTGHIRVS